MITFYRKGNIVIAQIEANVGIEKHVFNFSVTLSDEVYACLLRQNFTEFLMMKVKSAREEAYNRGWNDKTARRRKETWFSPQL